MPILNDAKNVMFNGAAVSKIMYGETPVWEWTPAALFALGQQGVWYEPKPQYLFQDAAGTIPVTADGDPVGLMLDRSPNGNHATQSVSAARPIYRTDGVLHWLEQDSVDDTLTFQIYDDPASAVVDSLFVGMSGIQADNIQGGVAGSFVYWGNPGGTGPYAFLVQSNRIRTWSSATDAGAGENHDFSVNPTGPYMLSLQVAEGTLVDRRSTSEGNVFYENESIDAIRQTSTTQPWSIGAYTDYGNPNMTGLAMVVDQVSADDRARAQQYLQGLTL